MPTLTRAPTYLEPGQVQPISTGSEAFGASFRETWATGPAGAADIFQRLQASEDLTIGERYLDPLLGIESRKLSPKINPEDAKRRVQDAGLEGQVPLGDYPDGIRADTLKILIDENLAKVKRQTILSQADGWGAQVGGMLVGSVVDPVNVATAFIPVVGEARYARLLSSAGGMFGRAGVRIGVGAAEGAVGAAIVEPLIYAGQQQWRNDYDAYDSMLNVAGGALFGALLHAGSGLVKDAFGRPVGAAHADIAETDPGAAFQTELAAAQRAFEQGQVEGVDFGRTDRSDDLSEALRLSDEEYLLRVNPSQEITSRETATQLADELQDMDVPSTAQVIGKSGDVTLHAYGDYLYAADGDRVVGVLGTKPSGNEFAIDPEYRGRGIGRDMMKELLVRRPFAISGGLSAEAAATRLSALRAIRREASPAMPTLRARTGREAAEIIESRLESLRARITTALSDGQVKELQSEDSELLDVLREHERAATVVSASPTGRLTPDELSFITRRRSEIRLELEANRANQGYRRELSRLEERLSKIDLDSDLIALSERLSPPMSPGGAALQAASDMVRPVVAKLDPQTQAAALRHAVAQDAQGRSVDVSPALLSDPAIRDTRGALNAAQSNQQQWASADPAAASEASAYVAERPQTTLLDDAKQQLADDQSRFQEIGGDPEAIEFEGVDVKQVNDAVKAATLCMMRNVA